MNNPGKNIGVILFAKGYLPATSRWEGENNSEGRYRRIAPVTSL